jgi:hypothetical protein
VPRAGPGGPHPAPGLRTGGLYLTCCNHVMLCYFWSVDVQLAGWSPSTTQGFPQLIQASQHIHHKTTLTADCCFLPMCRLPTPSRCPCSSQPLYKCLFPAVPYILAYLLSPFAGCQRQPSVPGLPTRLEALRAGKGADHLRKRHPDWRPRLH